MTGNVGRDCEYCSIRPPHRLRGRLSVRRDRSRQPAQRRSPRTGRVAPVGSSVAGPASVRRVSPDRTPGPDASPARPDCCRCIRAASPTDGRQTAVKEEYEQQCASRDPLPVGVFINTSPRPGQSPTSGEAPSRWTETRWVSIRRTSGSSWRSLRQPAIATSVPNFPTAKTVSRSLI